MRFGLARRVLVGALLAGAAALVHCSVREPTQIVVTVRASDGECATIHSTYVRVKTTDDLSVAATASKEGCPLATKVIGTFVLVPEGAPDAPTKFLVATGIKGKQGDLCKFDDPDCIFAKRITRFIPNETVRLDVLMSGACLGKTCAGANETCENGVCTSAVVEPAPGDCAASGTCLDAGSDGAPAGDAGVDADAAPDVVVDPCLSSTCVALGGACQLDGSCAFTCSTAVKCNNKVCPPGLECRFNCSGLGACNASSCTAANPRCSFTCTGVGACEAMACAATTCTLSCTGGNQAQRACGNTTMSTGGTVSCGDDNDCGAINCNGAANPCNCPLGEPSVCNGNCNQNCR
ncbi:MAG: hypothetical protein KF819_37230 [Labilithrix sp.]|nr:hypothetical protein [Labilithrix sp.]